MCSITLLVGRLILQAFEERFWELEGHCPCIIVANQIFDGFY